MKTQKCSNCPGSCEQTENANVDGKRLVDRQLDLVSPKLSTLYAPVKRGGEGPLRIGGLA
jgi:hypothetical protein